MMYLLLMTSLLQWFWLFTDLPRIEIQSYTTKFWRHQQEKPSTYLATIEAIYYFVREYHALFEPEQYEGQYDNLLFYFCFHYQQIREQYDNGKYLKAYDRQTKDKTTTAASAENTRTESSVIT